MDQTQRKLPKSKKAMEYRVYWLERKLTYMKLNEKRELNRTCIEAMPDSQMKDLLHLNNEFHRANEVAIGLKKFTEELNQDTLKLNERSERLHEVGAEKLSATDRSNRQALRLQERGRKINKESLRTTTLSRAINKATRDGMAEAQGRIEEANYLSGLTRAQHTATDALNQRTRSLNQEALKATAESLKLNRTLADTTDTTRALNQKSKVLQEELDQLKTTLAAMGDNTLMLNASTEAGLKEIKVSEQNVQDATTEAKELVTLGKKQIKQTKALITQSKGLNAASTTATKNSLETQQAVEQHLQESRQEFETLNDTTRERIADLLTQSREEIEAHQARQTATLLQIGQNQESTLLSKIDDSLSQTETQILVASDANSAKLTQQLTEFDNSINELRQTATHELDRLSDDTRAEASTTLGQFGQDARLRFIAFESRANQLTEGFVAQTTADLALFSTQGSERIQEADDLLQVLSGRAKQNLDEGELFVTETRQLNRETRDVNADTKQLNLATEALVDRSEKAIGQIDGAIQEVNAVSRKLFRETRELQDRSNLMNEASERLHGETAEANHRSLNIQSESLQTQSLSQEINSHSLELNDETQRIHASFVETRDNNAALVTELQTLRASLVNISKTVETELESTKNSNQESHSATAKIKTLGQETRHLNDQTNELIHAATVTIEESKQYNQQTESLISGAQSIQQELKSLLDEVRSSESNANDAAGSANQAVDVIAAVKVDLIKATQQTETVTAEAITKIEALSAISTETETINADAKLAQEELKQVVANSRDINDGFMRGLESVSKKVEQTDLEANQVLNETRTLQDEINNILQLRHGINGFQQSVDICQERLQDLTSSVALCQEDTAGQADLIGQYQRRIDAFQGDVSRYRDSVMQFEARARQLESTVADVNNRLEEIDQLEQERLAGQVEKMRKLELDMRQSLAEKQTQLDTSIDELQAKTEKQLETISTEILKDVDQRLQSVGEQTDARLIKTSETIQDLGSDLNNLNRSLMEEIRALKTQTSAIKEQHGVFQQEQRTHISEQKKRTQNQDYELDTIQHQLENTQRLLETPLDDQPHQELQQRVKSIEGNLRQHQRMLKVHESQQEKIDQDDRVEQLRQMVETMGRSMQEVFTVNEDLKRSLEDTKSSNHNLQHNNQTLEASLQSRQEEVNNCFQRIQRLETREANFEEMITALKSRDTDTQQTLLQMDSAVKDSTRAMRETQRTLERLKQPSEQNKTERTERNEKKRDWLSTPKQAVMTSLFAALITGLTFLGYDEVDASFLRDEPVAVLEASPRLLAQPPQRVSLDKTLSSLARANSTIADLGEFAWPVNFGIVDPEAIEYRTHHQGISIKGEFGDPVVAVNDGKVIYSGNEIRGYGNIIVIQHDNDLVSIYANNQFNYVAEGDSIRRGQLIGDIGQLFDEDAAGLYFEIRHNGEPEDPFNYLRSNQSMDLLTAR